MPVLERLWKRQWRVASTGNLPMGVTLLCIWQEAGFGTQGCFESGSGLWKWKECRLSQRLSCRCQRASKAAVDDESVCTVPGQQGV